jgi:hypothetical protein
MKREFGRQGFTRRSFGLLAILAIGLVYACSSMAATEVYTWTDDNGVVHYGDSPPEAGESKKINVEEAYRPGTAGAYPGDDDKQPPSPPQAGEDAREEAGESVHSAAEQRREKIAKDRKERREEQAETARMCERHRKRLEQMEPARRVFYTNEQGESVRMDDNQRIALIEEDKEYIQKNCD